MDNNFYSGFEKQAALGAMFGAVRSGLSTAANLARTSGITSSARAIGRNIRRGNFSRLPQNFAMLGRSAGRAVGRMGTVVGQKLDPQMASVRAMNQKVTTSARNLMDSAQKKF